MRYFIGYAFQGNQKDAIDELRKKISKKFDVHEALRIPPHITLFYPFETKDVKPLERALEEVAASQPKIGLSITGFHSFDEAVWFLDVEQKPELFSLKEAIVGAVQRSLHLEENRKGKGIHFHCTLAYKDVSSEVFRQIGNSLKYETLPVRAFSIDAITLFQFSENRWTPVTTFRLKG